MVILVVACGAPMASLRNVLGQFLRMSALVSSSSPSHTLGNQQTAAAVQLHQSLHPDRSLLPGHLLVVCFEARTLW
jgi:hypothetical protein